MGIHAIELREDRQYSPETLPGRKTSVYVSQTEKAACGDFRARRGVITGDYACVVEEIYLICVTVDVRKRQLTSVRQAGSGGWAGDPTLPSSIPDHSRMQAGRQAEKQTAFSLLTLKKALKRRQGRVEK